MAELGPEGLDDFQDRIDELGDYLFTTLTNSVEAAAQTVNLGGISKSLTLELTKGLKDVEVDKILNDKLLKDTKVQKVMTDVQKKFEDSVGNINFKINNIQLPTKPLFVDIKASKFDTTGLVSKLQVPVVFDYEKLSLPKPNTIEVPVEFLYDKFQLPKSSPINVAVKYAYDKFLLPKAQDVNVYVSYVYDKFKLPKIQPVNIPVEYSYEDIIQPSVDDIQVPVSYQYEQFKLPKSKGIDVLVSYAYDKFQLPKASPILVNVGYAYEKFIQPKISELSVPVSYNYDNLQLPKNQSLNVGVSYDYTPFKLPVTSKDKSIGVVVDYLYSKFALPKAQPINVPVSYVYDKFVTPKVQSLSVPVDYKYDKLVLPTAKALTVPVKYQYESFKLPKDQVIDVFVDFIYTKLELPKVNPINVAVKYAYDKFTQPKVGSISVPVSYDYDKLTLPKKQNIDVSVGYDYTPFRLPVTEKDKSINIAVDYIFSKFSLPKTSSISIPVNYIYDKFTLPKQDSLSVFVEYEYDELVLPKQSVSVPVTYDYEKFTLPTFKPIDVLVNYITNKLITPKVDNIKVPVNYVYDSFKMPKVGKLEVPVTYSYDKLTLPKTQGIDVLVDYVYNKLQLPKNQELNVSVGYEYDTFTLPKVTDLEIPVSYAYDKFNLPKANSVSVPVKYLYDKFLLPKSQKLTVPVDYSYSKLQLPTKQSINVSVSYEYEALKLPKPSIDVAVRFAYDKLMLPKVDALQVGVKYNYDKLVIPKPNNIKIGVNYIYDKFVEPIAKAIKVPVKYIYDKFTQPIADTLTIPTEYEYDDLEIPAAEELKIPVRYSYDKFQLPKIASIDVFVDYIYSKFQLPKISKLLIPVEYEYTKLAEQKEQTLTVQVKYKYDKLITPAVKSITIPVKYLYDKFTQPKVAPLIVKVAPDTTTLKNIPKVGVTAEVTSFNTDLIQQTANSLKPIAVSATTAPLESFNNLTTSVKSAGDAATTLVTILGQVAGKATVSLEAFNKLKEAAYQLVDASRMTRSEVDAMLGDLQTRVPDLNVSARVNTLDTSLVDEATISPINIPSTVASPSTTPTSPAPATPASPTPTGGTDNLVSSLTQATRQKQQLLTISNQLLNTNAITQQQYDAMIAAANAQYDAAVDLYNTNSSLLSRHRENKKEISESLQLSNLLNIYANESSDLLRERQLAQRELNKLSDAELRSIAQQYPIQNQQRLTSKELKNLLIEKIVSEKQRVNLLDDLNSAQLDYNKALRSADADMLVKQATISLNLTEQETSELAYQIMLQNQLNGKGLILTEQDKQRLKEQNKILRHKREEVKLIEHVAEYQKKINEELEELTSKWTNFKATLGAIAQNPALAKGALFASSVAMVEKLTHSVHDFKEAGMDAGTAVSATFKGLTFNSLLGLSDTRGVLKSITQEFGTLNALTSNQVDAVGKLAKGNGLAAEETTNMVMAISRMPGQTRETASNSEAMFKSIAKTKGVIPAQVMKEVAKNSSLMATYSKGGAEGFIRAAASAKKMGVELSTMLNAARKTLDFESSINAEMEASALLGKSLNSDALRRAALSGDAEAIQREQVKLIQQAGGLDKMNVLQKEKLAELMGLSVDEMQKINDSAKYQEEHFGEQAGTWAHITGYMGTAVKYGEGMLTGFAQMAPAITGIASIMSIMNIKSMKELVSGTMSMVRGMAAGVVQAGLFLAKMLAIGATKLFGSKEQVDKVKNFFSKDGAAGSFVDKIKGKKPELPAEVGSADKTAEVGDKAKQASDKTKAVQPGTGIKQFFTNLAAGLKAMGTKEVLFGAVNTIVAAPALVIMAPGALAAMLIGKVDGKAVQNGLKGIAKGVAEFGQGKVFAGALAMILATPGLIALSIAAIPLLIVGAGGKLIQTGLQGIASGISYMGDPKVLKGILGLALIGVALIPFAYAMSLIAGLDIDSVIAAAAGLVIFSAAVFGLGALIAGPGAIIFGAGLLGLIGLGIALSVLGEGLQKVSSPMQVFTDAFSSFLKSVDPNSLLKVSLSLPLLSIGIFGLAASLVYAGAAAIALGVLGIGLTVFGLAIQVAANGAQSAVTALQALSSIKADNFGAIGDGLLKIAKGLGAIGLTGLAAVPVLAALSKLGMISPPTAETPKAVAPGTAATAPAVKAAPPMAPAPTPTAAPTTTTQQTTEKSTKESTTDISIIADKLTELITVMKSGAVINVDGRKLASVVQSNIRALKFTD